MVIFAHATGLDLSYPRRERLVSVSVYQVRRAQGSLGRRELDDWVRGVSVRRWAWSIRIFLDMLLAAVEIVMVVSRPYDLH